MGVETEWEWARTPLPAQRRLMKHELVYVLALQGRATPSHLTALRDAENPAFDRGRLTVAAGEGRMPVSRKSAGQVGFPEPGCDPKGIVLM